MINPTRLIAATFVALVSMTIPVLAHTGVGHADTFSHGFWHPLNGLDHVLAMVAVGFYAASLGGRASWLVPSAFVGMMILGGLLGYLGFSLPLVETGIGLSVVLIGLALTFGVRLPTVAAMTVVGLFAVFHGHAHGSEGAGLGVAFVPFAAGFVIATVSLHMAGITLGFCLDRLGGTPSNVLRRVAGAVGGLVGVCILTGWLVT
jgi:urease accessory protein